MRSIVLRFIYLITAVVASPSFWAVAPSAWAVTQAQRRVVMTARELLDTSQVSYVYGGSALGDSAQCVACNTCLHQKSPAPKSRLQVCPQCQHCSLDCSHFTQLVFQMAGFKSPYLPTDSMLQLSASQLLQKYNLVDLGADTSRLQPGDLLVYRGHVVMLERLRPTGRGDIIHATGGRDIKEPGQGIQRERFAQLGSFRGPLLRVLRHKELR